MEVNLPKKQFTYYREVFQTAFPQEETYEAVVSDVLPDIREILDVTGYTVVRSKDVYAGGVSLTGQITATVLYAPDGELGVKCSRMSIPYQAEVENSAIPDNAIAVAEIQLLQLSAEVRNPRKIAVKAELLVRCTCYVQESVELPVPGGEGQGLHFLAGAAELTPVELLREKSFVVSDEYILPGSKSEGTELLRQELRPRVDSVKCSGGRLLVKGVVEAELLFLSRGEAQPVAALYRTPFTQVLDLEEELEDAMGQAQLLLTGAFFEQTTGAQGESAVLAEFHLAAQILCTGTRTVPYIADAYSNQWPVELEEEKRADFRCREAFSITAVYRETLDTLGEARQVTAVSVTTGRCGISEGKLYAGLGLCVLYGDSQGLMRSARQRTRLEEPLQQEEEGLRLLDVRVTEVSAVPAQGGIELRAALEFVLQRAEPVEWTYIRDIQCSEDAPLDDTQWPSVLLKTVTPKQSLWRLAKSCHSTVEAIRSANGLEEDVQDVQGLIMIPKCR